MRDANAEGFETVVVRPRLVWGPGDTTILPSIKAEVEKGRFAWIGGGGHLTSTSHVDNVVEGLVLAAERGSPAASTSCSTTGPVEFRDFITRLLATAGVEAPTRTMPAPIARFAAGAGEGLFKLLRRENPPPVTRIAVWLSSLECTLDDSRAREELGYRPVVSRRGGPGASWRQRPVEPKPPAPRADSSSDATSSSVGRLDRARSRAGRCGRPARSRRRSTRRCSSSSTRSSPR